MQERHSMARPTPMLPTSCYRTLLHVVAENHGHLIATWDALTAASGRHANGGRAQGQALLDYLLRHLSDVTDGESAFIHAFLEMVSSLEPSWDVTDIVLILSDFEELILSIARSELSVEDQEPVYHWIHSLGAKLVQAALHDARDQAPDTPHSALKGSGRLTSPRQNGQSGLLEQLLSFDEHLLSAHEASELFQTVVTDICEISGFGRSALFLYNPLTKTVEGLFAHHVNLDEVRRIRESERRIPILNQVMRLPKPVFIPDVSPVLPMHYVRHFQLTSLLVCPVLGQNGKSIGVLLVDEGGKPFSHSPSRLELIDKMMKRVSLALGLHLQGTRSSPAVERCSLTNRELDVLQLIADGCHTKSTANHLHISEHTVTEHVTSILRKLGVSNRAAAVAKGLRAGIIH